MKVLFGIKWKDVRKNDKFQQIFRRVPNIPNDLECFMEDTIYIFVSEIFLATK